MSQEVKPVSAFKTLEAEYEAKIAQIRKDFRDILNRVRAIKEMKDFLEASKSRDVSNKNDPAQGSNPESLPPEGSLPKSSMESGAIVIDPFTKYEQDFNNKKSDLKKIVSFGDDKKILVEFAQKVFNPLVELETNVIKLNKVGKKLPSFIKRHHLKELVSIEPELLSLFIGQDAWLSRLIGTDTEKAAQESKEQFEKRLQPFKDSITKLSEHKASYLPLLKRFEEGTLSEFTHFSREKRSVENIIQSLRVYASRATDEGHYKTEIDDEYGKYKDIPLHYLSDSLRKKQGKVLDNILGQLARIDKFRKSDADISSGYQAQITFLEKVLKSQQPWEVELEVQLKHRAKLIAKEEKRFKEEDKDYLAAADDQKKQKHLLQAHLSAFQGKLPDIEEEQAAYLEQQKEYAILFKKNINPFGLSKDREEADTYVLTQLTKLYRTFVVAESARIVLAAADASAKEKQNVKVASPSTTEKQSNVAEDNDSSRKSGYGRDRFFTEGSHPSSTDEELQITSENTPK
ncbi:hypothetical protein [Legionella hackeliae]|uniref:Uncharacterized protein n=1 Tax=Legionella hackeliae TaxID=449 RepID=A0A0A8ULV5_LEGHA|nr:hypothetical protein [Legionella hackeliae]KTD10356.1 hypothetical protein Lhac_2724 [Legionella hackeliae]CEK09855.1 protein of unknown function [Legionella hackeliae]STX49765.1 Uncharacterised protein [Legionella hackeliae]